MNISGFHIVRKSDQTEIVRWTSIPVRIELTDGTVVIRLDGAFLGWDDGNYTISTTSWTIPDPPPITVAAWSAFVGRFTDTEWAGVQSRINTQVSAGNGALARFVALSAVNGVDMTNPQTQTYKSQLVSLGILTQARADAIFVAP